MNQTAAVGLQSAHRAVVGVSSVLICANYELAVEISEACHLYELVQTLL